MSEKSVAFEYCDKMVEDFEKVIEHPVCEKSAVYYTGVDLGTACVVIAVLDENKRPVAGAYRYADVVRDGMVVDYIGAVQIVRELKEQIEEQLDTELIYAAGAIPPGTDLLDSGAVKNVIQGAGFECTNLLVLCAILIALAYVLGLVQLFNLPFGGETVHLAAKPF